MSKGVGALIAFMVLLLLVVVMMVSGAVTGGVAGSGAQQEEAAGAGDSSTANVPEQYRPDIEAATKKCSQLRGSLLAAQVWAESKWDPKASSGYANGIAQFTPAAWSDYGTDGDGDGKKDVWNPHDAIPSQGVFMCKLYRTIKADMESGRITRGTLDENVLAAYNGGPGLPEGTGGFPTGVSETDTYVPRILAKEKDYQGAGSVPVVAGPFAQKAVQLLKSTLGIPYVLGGGTTSGPSMGGYDCSGLTLYVVYHATGGKVTLPHSAARQHVDPRFRVVARGGAHSQALRDAVKKAQPGDLISFNVPEDPAPWGHVGIAIGNGRMIHAPNPGKSVENIPIYEGYELQVARLSTQK